MTSSSSESDYSDFSENIVDDDQAIDGTQNTISGYATCSCLNALIHNYIINHFSLGR